MSFGYLLLRPFAVLIYHTGIKKSNERVHKMETDMALSWLSELGKRVFGSMDGLFYTLVAFVVIDYITGVCVAIHNKQLSSDVGAHGIAKKIAIFALVSLSNIIDRFLLGSEDVLRTVTTVFYMANEAMSIMENVGKVGLPLPQKLQNFLSHLRNTETTRMVQSRSNGPGSYQYVQSLQSSSTSWIKKRGLPLASK